MLLLPPAAPLRQWRPCHGDFRAAACLRWPLRRQRRGRSKDQTRLLSLGILCLHPTQLSVLLLLLLVLQALLVLLLAMLLPLLLLISFLGLGVTSNPAPACWCPRPSCIPNPKEQLFQGTQHGRARTRSQPGILSGIARDRVCLFQRQQGIL